MPSGTDPVPSLGVELPSVAEEPPVTAQEVPMAPEAQVQGEIPQEAIKEALKEIITEIEEAVVEETPEVQQVRSARGSLAVGLSQYSRLVLHSFSWCDCSVYEPRRKII